MGGAGTWVPNEEGEDLQCAQLEFWHPQCKVPTLHPGWQGGVMEDIGFMGTAYPASSHVGEGAAVVNDSLKHNEVEALKVVLGVVTMWWACDQDVGPV